MSLEPVQLTGNKILVIARDPGKPDMLRKYLETYTEKYLETYTNTDRLSLLVSLEEARNSYARLMSFAFSPSKGVCFSQCYVDDMYDTARYRTEFKGRWLHPPPSGKRAWEPAKWQQGTDHKAPLKHGKNPKAVDKRRKARKNKK